MSSIKSSVDTRISNIRKKLGVSQDAFAGMLELKAKTTVSSWENGASSPNYEMLMKIADLGKVSLDWLITGIESTYTPPLTAPESLVGEVHNIYKAYYVPVVSTVTAGDTGAILEESNIMYMVPVAEKPTPTSIMVEVSGDSMTRDRGRSINPGDLVYIDTKETIVFDGDLVVVTTLDGRQLVKQYLNRDKETIELRSFNPEYPPIYLPKSEIVNFFRVLQVHPKIWKA